MNPLPSVSKPAIRRLRLLFMACLFPLAGLIAVNLWMVQTARPFLFQDIGTLPHNQVALVLGVDLLLPNGTTNTHFLARTRNAAELFKAGKADRLLVSGHPNNRGYNEPRGMATELQRLGVPSGCIDLDEDGERTWHSIVSARQRWNLEKFTIVTDEFHAPRAIYLSRKAGLDAIAFCPPATTADRWTMHSEVREWLARGRALGDGF